MQSVIMDNFFESLVISDGDIEEVEDSFFNSRSAFNAEQRQAIRIFSSQNIQACPGSGKTTTLAAKLRILKDKLPANNKSGICILTHTNVAVEIIKEKLGPKYSGFYLNYPNFLGTIQSFTNRFLAIPFYKTLYKHPISNIDDDLFYSLIGRLQKTAYGASMYLSSAKKIDHFGDLSFNNSTFEISVKSSDRDPVVKITTETYKKLLEIKNKLLEQGYLKYDEAYSLAFKYLREFPLIEQLFSKRFNLVFLDEMQDTEESQFNLMEKLFSKNCIFQTIGDLNQDLYDNANFIEAKWPKSKSCTLSTSSRFSNVIATFINKVSVYESETKGNPEITNINPHVIVYSDNNIEKVKEKFAELIIEKGLHTVTNGVFKAVGYRRHAETLSIRSYFNDFDKSSGSSSGDYESVEDYLNILKKIDKQEDNLINLKELLMSIVLKSLKLCSVKNPSNNFNFNTHSFERFVKEKHPVPYLNFRNILFTWIRKVLNQEEIKELIVDYIQNTLLRLLNAEPSKQFIEFCNKPAINNSLATAANINEYYFVKGNNTIKVSFDTIHGVKGETHTATLYLETFTRTFDIPKILPLLAGLKNKTPTLVKNEGQRMKNAYVAMSRPSHFICLAVHKDRIDIDTDWSRRGIDITIL